MCLFCTYHFLSNDQKYVFLELQKYNLGFTSVATFVKIPQLFPASILNYNISKRVTKDVTLPYFSSLLT